PQVPGAIREPWRIQAFPLVTQEFPTADGTLLAQQEAPSAVQASVFVVAPGEVVGPVSVGAEAVVGTVGVGASASDGLSGAPTGAQAGRSAGIHGGTALTGTRRLRIPTTRITA